MKKNILVTTALASSLIFLGSNAIAQTKIDGTLTIGYKETKNDLQSQKVNDVRGFGREAQLNVSNSGNLNVGGLKYAAGFALEFDGKFERNKDGNISIANENTYVNIIAGDTTITFGVDHIQNSDRTTANFVGLNVEDLDNANTSFLSSVGANPKESIGAGIMQKTPFGTLSALYVPSNGHTGSDDDLDGFDENAQGQAATMTNLDRSSAYEIGFVGDLGIKGLNVHAFTNKEKASPGSLNVNKSLAGTNYGVSYNFGQFTFGVDKKVSEGKYATTDTNSETDQMAYGLAYAITPTLTLGANYAKASLKNVTTAVKDDKFKGIALGYNLGPVVAEAQYGQYESALGVDRADGDVYYARVSTKF